MQFVTTRKILISMLFIAATLLGLVSYKQLKMEIIPNAELPMLYIQVSSRIDVTPEYMEQKAIIPIESAVAGLADIELIESTVGRRRGIINISYEKNTDIKYAYLKLSEEVNSLLGQIPDEFTAQVIKMDLEQGVNTLMTIHLRGEGDENRLRNIADQYLVTELENIDGVAGITVFGGQQKSVEVILDQQACDAYGVSPNRIRMAIAQNMNQRQYAGLLQEEGLRFFVYLDAEYDNIRQIEDIIIGRGNQKVKLADIATVYYGEKESETISRVNGKSSVTLLVINDAEANIIDVSHNVQRSIEDINRTYEPQGVELEIQSDLGQMMEDNLDQIIRLALIGGLLAIFVLWIFMRNLRLIILVALAMPISVYTAFNFFYAFGISINSLTLVGIALAIGMLLDTSVVVLENIYRLRSLGKSATESVIQGTAEVWRSIVAATLTTVAVFVPFLFSGNLFVRLLGKHIGISIISTLSMSLIVSLMLIPMPVYVVMARHREHSSGAYQTVSIADGWVRYYLLILKAALRNPAATIILVLVLFFVTIAGSLSVSVNKMKSLETNQITFQITMPTGSTLEATDEYVQKLEASLSEIKEKNEVSVRIEEEEAQVTVLLVDDFYKVDKRNYGTIKDDAANRVNDLTPNNISFDVYDGASSGQGGMPGSGGGGGSRRGNASGEAGFLKMMGIGEDEEYLVLKGQDFDLMMEVAEVLQTYIEESENVSRVNISVRDNQPEAHIDFSRILMSDYGISQNQVSSELGAFQNEVSSGVQFKQGTEQYDIIITYDDAQTEDEVQEKTLEDLRTLEIPNDNDNAQYELQSFADVFFSRGMRELTRVNQEKQIEIRYRYNSDVTDSKELLAYARDEIQSLIDAANIPSGIAVELVQEESTLDEFKVLLYIALLLVFMILASIFESLLTPFVLLFSIPLAAIGSFLMLTITGNSLFNANTITGFLILLGVVVNNGILLIDFINILRKRGYRMQRAILTAGMSRIRPILITAITTCVAMVPLALGKSEYVASIGPPFAVTVIGGLTLSTLLTLVFIPMLYNGLEFSVQWIKGLHIAIRISMLILVVTGLTLVALYTEKFMWKAGLIVLIVAGVPVMFWFVMNSLRKAREQLFDPSEELTIRISNLVKIYGRPGKISRDIKAIHLRLRSGGNKPQHLSRILQALIWQLPMLAFMVYFAWFYITIFIWTLIVAILTIAFINILLNIYFKGRTFKGLNLIKRVAFWGLPLVAIALMYLRDKNSSQTITVGVLWYVFLTIYAAILLVRSKTFDLKRHWKVYRWFLWLLSKIPGIGAQREQFKALKGVSLDIGTGMFGLLGPNGAGKSTMIRTICGILEQSYGKIWINGVDTQVKREELQGLIGYLPQEFGMYENMTAEAYLEYQAILKGITDVDTRNGRIREVLESVHMWENRRKKIGSFSGGMKQRIGIAQVLLHLPRILVVDEPTAGLDPRERIRFRNLLVELSRSRIVIFSTHIIEDISSSCNTMAVINKGEVLFNGTPKEMNEVARGKVWKFTVPAKLFDEVTSGMMVVHHMRDGDQIRVRSISDEPPYNGAVVESPLLEDAYLWLLQKSNKSVSIIKSTHLNTQVDEQ